MHAEWAFLHRRELWVPIVETASHQTEIAKLNTLPRSARPRCGVTTQKGTPCMGQSMSNGRCYLHNHLPRGVSPEGQARQAASARKHMTQMWSKRWGPNGRKLSDEGRTRISEAQKQRWAGFRERRETRELAPDRRPPTDTEDAV